MKEIDQARLLLKSYEKTFETGFLHYIDNSSKFFINDIGEQKLYVVSEVKRCKNPNTGEPIKANEEQLNEITESAKLIKHYLNTGDIL